MPTLEKLKILAFRDDKFLVPLPIGAFVAMFNPESYSTTHSVDYCETKDIGGNGGTITYKRVRSKDFSFDLTFDGTGVGGLKVPVPIQVANFLMLSKINGTIHRPPYLILNWGTLVLKCVLEKATVSYTLFDSFGVPLRAKVTASFKEALSGEKRAKDANKNSPDLTHEVIVKAGDTLPMLCYEKYGDISFYKDVARINNITNFRKLKEGTTLYFPPIVNESISE